MAIIDPKEFMNATLYSNTLKRKDCIVPLFVYEGKKPKLLGSSVYLKIEDQFFLATAGHIVEESRSLHLPSAETVIESVPTKRFNLFKEWADVAVCKLERELKFYSAVEPSNVREFRLLPRTMTLFALGYPRSHAKVFKTTIDCKVYSIMSYEAEANEYAAAGIDPETNIIVKFDRDNMTNSKGERISAPILNGMSGGGLFWIHDSGRITSAEPMLIGILTRWLAEDETTIVATKLSVVDALVRDHGKTLFR
jgi:hypothetical protein